MKRKLISCSAAVFALACFAIESAGQTTGNGVPASPTALAANAPSPAIKQKIVQEYGKLPLRFEVNQGQTDSRVKFLSRGPGYQLSLLPDGAVLTIRQRLKAKPATKKFGVFHTSTEQREAESVQLESVSMALVGAAANAQVGGIQEMPGKSNYFVGNDPAKWRTNVANFAKVRYQGVYPGIDLIYHGSQQQLEYDFVVAPGADPRRIRLRMTGAKSVRLTPEGDLELATSGEPVRLRKPAIYQESAGKRQPVDGSFVLAANHTVKFRVGAYDHARALVIDPTFFYATVLGGDGFDEGLGIAIDAANNAYVGGSTMSTDFAVPPGSDPFHTLANCSPTPGTTTPCEEAFVAKLTFTVPPGGVNPVLALQYVTFLGSSGLVGTGTSIGNGIAVCPLNAGTSCPVGDVYVTGTTTAQNFPTTTGAFQTTLKGTENAFVSVLNSTGSALVFSTYLGGSGSEGLTTGDGGGTPIAVDSSGNAYVAGTTTSPNFPTTSGVFQATSGSGIFHSADSGTTFTVGNTNLNNFDFTSIVVDPGNPNIIYVATNGGGVFKSVDTALTWTAINGTGTTALPTLAINTLVADSASANNFYVGTANGVFKTTDGGITWNAINNGLTPTPGSTAPADVSALAVVPGLFPTTVYAGGSEGIFRTLNGGTSWILVNNGLPSFPEIQTLAIDPITPANVYAGAFQNFFKTTNGGASWVSSNSGLVAPGTTTPLDVKFLAIDAKTTTTLYVTSTFNGFNALGVFRSTDGGNTWAPANSGLTDLNVSGLAVDPTIAGTVFLGTLSSGVFKSTDGGNTWSTVSNTLSNSIIGPISVDPGAHSAGAAKVYAGSPVFRPFISKFSPAGAIQYSTFAGGNSEDVGFGVAVDAQGNAYISGATVSRDFPTTSGAFQTTRKGLFDAFYFKLNSTGTAPAYSTYLGGFSGGSEALGIAVDSQGAAYLTGFTQAADFPITSGAFQTINHSSNGFVTKFTPAGALSYSTFLGGSVSSLSTVSSGSSIGAFLDEPGSIAVDSSGDAWVTGFTVALDFPTANPIRATPPCASGSSSCFFSNFISEVNPTGTSLLFSTLLGPTDSSSRGSIALDSQGNAYITGATNSADFPTLNPLTPPPTPAPNTTHAFVAKIGNPPTGGFTDLSVTLHHTPDPVATTPAGTPITFTAVIANNGPNPATGVTFYPTQIPNTTIRLFRQLAAPNPTNPTSTQGTCDTNEFCFIGNMAPGATVSVTMVVEAVPGDEGTQTVAVGVGGNQSDPTPANNVATDIVNVSGGVDLALASVSSPLPGLVGSNLTYTLAVNNKSANPADAVTLTYTLPAGATFVSATPALPASQICSPSGTSVFCSLGTLAGQTSTGVAIVVTPSAAGTLSSSASVTSTEADINPSDNSLQIITDVVASPNPNNARFKGPYAWRMEGFKPDALMAFAGEFIADGLGGINTGFWDVNTGAGVTVNQQFTGTYSVGSDNRVTINITVPGAPTQTFRAALGSLNASGVATKATFIEFDNSGQTGSGVIELQSTSAFSSLVLGTGSFAFRQSGEDINVNHFATAGQIALTQTTSGNGTVAGTLDSNKIGTLTSNAAFTGTFTIVQTGTSGAGRGTLALNFPGPVTLNYAFYVVSASEVFLISTDQRSATIVMSSGFALRQRVLQFSNAWLNGPGVFNMSGVHTDDFTEDVSIGLLTGNGAGSATLLTDRDDGGVVTLNQPSSHTYSVASNGRTTFNGTQPPTLYLYDLNSGFFVGGDANASTGRLEQQSAPPLNNSTFSGPIFIGSFTPNALQVSPFIGTGTLNLGNIEFTEDINAPGFLISDLVFSGTYSVAPNGRITVGSGAIAYQVSPNKVVSINASPGKTNDVVAVTEGGTRPSTDVAIAGPATAQATVGAQFQVVYTISNLGTIPNTGVDFSAVPSNTALVTLVSAVPSQGACVGTAAVNCGLGSIASGSSAQVTLTLMAVAVGNPSISANVLQNELDPNNANNGTSTSITITTGSVGSADMALIKTVSPTSVIQGANFTYTVTAFNNGPNAATNVTVTDPLPAGTTFVQGASSASCAGTTTVTCNLGGVAVGASATANIVVTTTAAGTITNTATISADQTDPSTANNTGVAIATAVASTAVEGYILTDVNSPQILEFNAANNASLGLAHAGTNPDGIAISPNGRLAFIGNVNANYVSVIDLTLNAEIARIRNVRASRNLALNADGSRLVVPSANTDELDIIDTSTFQVLNRVNLSTLLGDSPSNPQTGLGSVVVVSHFAYVNTGVTSTSPNTPVVAVDINAGTATVIPNSNVGFPRVHGNTIAATPDGKFVAVTRLGPPTLLIINTLANTVQNVTLPAGSAPSSIAITRNAGDPNGIFGYLQLSPTAVATVDFNPGSATFGQLISGGQVTLTDNQAAGSIAITADGTRVITTSKVPGVAHNVNVLDASKIRTGAAGAIVSQFFAGNPATAVIDSIRIAPIQQTAPAGAPVVSTITPSSAANSAAIPVHITGSGFAAGALVRVGTLDPIASTGNATAIDITIPQFAAAQNAAVIVTNPNSTVPIANQQVSGISPAGPGAFQILPSASFLPLNEVAVTNTGDNAVAILNDATKAVSATPVSGGPLGMAISADGLRAYDLAFRSNAFDVLNLDSKLKENTIAFASDTGFVGQVDAIVTAPNLGSISNGDPAEFVLTSNVTNTTTGTTDLRLVVIDSSPTSANFNGIIRNLQAGTADTGAFPGALGVTTDGKFAYANDANNGDLAIFNLVTGAATIVPVAALNDNVFQGHIEVTPDAKSLILVNPTGSLLVFDITNPVAPVLVTTITGTPPAGLNPLFFSNYRVVGNHLFAFDNSQNCIQAFNFNRTTPNFSQIASFVVPGHLGIFSSGFAVTPDGALLYQALEEDDAMAVIDVTKLLAGNPAPLITTIGTGLTPSAIVISPIKALVANLSITKTANPTTVTQGTSVTYTITVTNSGPSPSTGVIFTDPLPAGMTLVSAAPSQGTCNGTTTISCSLGNLAVGASASASIVAKATVVGSFTNTATASENETNPSTNSSASVPITVTNTSVCPTGTSIQWTGLAAPADNQWTTAANWNLARVPAAADIVCIDTPFAGATITLASSQVTIKQLVAASSLLLNGSSATTTLTINGTTTSNIASNLILNNAALNVTPGVAINGSLTSSGASAIGGTSSGLIVDGGLTINGGTLTVTGNGLVNFGPAVLGGAANLQLSPNTAFDNRSTFALNGSSVLTSAGSSFINRAAATLSITGSSLIATPVTNLGTVGVGGILNLSGGYTQTSGVTSLNTGGSITTNSPLAINGGVLVGNGVITGGATVSTGGIVSPGFSSPGTIGFVGQYTQGSTAAYNVEIGGLTAGTQYDQVTGPTSGTDSLGGVLNVSLIGGFVPVAGNSFTILTCAGNANCRTGTFATTNFPTLPNGLLWSITYNPTSVVLSVTTAAAGCGPGSNQWTGAGGNLLWATPANWSSNAIPVAADNVCIGTAFSASTITIGSLAAANQTVASLTSNATITVTAGPLTITGAATFVNALNVNSGSLALTSGGQAAAAHIAGGTLITNGALTLSGASSLSSGTLTGSGNITASGLFTWTGGTLVGTATPNASFNPNAGIDLNGGNANGSQHQLNQRTLNFPAGTVSLSGQSNSILLITGAVVHIPATTTLVFDQDGGLINSQGLINGGGTLSTVLNDGIIRKAAGNIGSTAINSGIAYNMSATGRLEVLSGTISLSSTGSSTGGTFLATSPGTLNFSGAYTTDAATSFTGSGNYIFSGGTVTITGIYNVTGDTLISGGTLAMNAAPVAINTIHLTGGSLTGTANITPSGLFTWTGGTLVGTATPNASFNPNAGIDLNGGNANGSQHQLNQRTLNFPAGTVSLSGQSNSILLITGAVVHVPATTTLVFDQDGGLINSQGLINGGGTLSTVLNDGIIRKAAGNIGSTAINSGIAYNMSATGRLEVLSGTISLSSTGSSTGGTFLATSPGTLNFSGAYTTDAATSFTGSGNYIFSGGTVTITGIYNVTGDTLISGGTLAMNAAPVAINTIHLTGGSLTGTANITPSGLFTWTGGTLVGTATPNASFNPNAGIDLNGGNANGSQHQLNQRTLNFPAGTVSLSGQSNSILLITGAVVHVPATTTLVFDQDGGLINSQGLINGGGTLSTVLNDGIIRKAAGNIGSTAINSGIAYNMSATGRLEVLSGTISLSSTGSSTGGTFLATSPGTLNFSGAYTTDAATSFTGSGNYIFSGGTVTITGIYNVTGDTLISGGTLAMNAAPVAINTIHLTGGSLTGTANITPSGLFTWTGGTLVGTATPNASFNPNAGIDLNGGNANGSQHQLNQRTLNFPAGTVSLSGQSNSILLITGAVVHVPATTTLVFDQDGGLINSQGLINGGGTLSTVLNDGIIRKAAGNIGSTAINSGIAYNMSATGRLEVLSGTISLSSTGSSTGGTFLATSPGTLNFSGAYTTDAATSFTGSGNYIFSGGTVTITGIYNVTGDTLISGGTLAMNAAPVAINTIHLTGGSLTGTANITPSGLFTWTGGTLLGTAVPNAIFSATGGIDFNAGNANGSGHLLNQRTLNLPTGTVNLSGQVNSISLVSGAVVHVPAGTTVLLDQDNGLSGNQGFIGAGGVTSTLLNDGTIRKFTGNSGTSIINGVNFNMSATGRLEVLSGTLSLVSSTGASTGGTFLATAPGVLNFNANYATDAGTSFTGTGNYIFASGTVSVAGTYNVTGDTAITSGTLNLNATPVAINTIHLTGGTLGGSANITPAGLFTWSGGQLAGTATPNAVFNANNGIDFNPTGGTGTAHTLVQRTLSLPAATVSFIGQSNTVTLSSGAQLHVPVGGTLAFDQDGGIGNQGVFAGGGVASSFLNDGTVRKVAGNTGSSQIQVPTTNTGTLESLSGTLALNVYTETAGVTRVNGGKLSSGTALNIQGGALMGVDVATPPTIVAPISNTGGIVHPGLSPGILSTVGSFSQSANGNFNVDINGTAPGTGFSQLNVNGLVTLGGTLNVALGGGFTPATGNSFTILTCSGTPTCLTGTFANTNFPALSGGLAWNITYNAQSVVLSIGAAVGADLSITNVPSVATTNVGAASFTYTLTAKNNGPSAATGVVVTDPLPTNVTFVSATSTVGTCAGTTTVTCTIGNLANAASAVITITVSPTTIGTATNTATVAGNEADPTPTNNSSTSTVQIFGTADLSVQISAPTSGLAGTEVGFTYTITNNGPNTGTGVTLTDTLPAGLTFVRAGGTTCTGAPALTCSVGNITSGTFQAITLVVNPSLAGTFTNTAKVSANEADPQPANNTAVNTFTATAAADLAASVTASPNPDGLGNPLNVSVNIINIGPSPATGVTITNPIPANTNVGAVTASQGTCAVATAIICNLGNLANGNTASVSIVLTPVTQVGTLTDTVTVAANETDPVPANNTASASVQIQQLSDVALAETVNSPILLGGNLTYTFTVTNIGPAVVSGPTLTDTLPPNVTFVGVNPAGGSACTPVVGNTFTCPIVGLAAGASVQFNVVVTPNAAGTFTNTGSVTSGGSFDPNLANNNASASANVNPAVDLSLGVTAPQAASVGSNLTFAYTIQNAGPSNATGVTFADTLPVGLTFVSPLPPSCVAVPSVNNGISCNLGGIAKGATANLSIVVHVLSAGTFTNTANVSANEPDLFPSNNTAVNTLTATASADIALTASTLPTTAVVNNNLTLTFFVKNNGPSPATGAFLVGVLSGSANVVSFIPTQGTCNTSVEFSCQLGNLAPGATASATMTFTPTAAGTLGYTANAGANEPDPITTNNSASGSVTIVSAPTVTLSTPSLNFASQPVGTPSSSQSVTLTNASNALPVTGLVIAASGDFMQTNNCGSGLATLASCSILVTFKPTATGTRTGAISITDNAIGSPQSVSLTGIGINAPAITLTPNSLVFSSRLVGTSSPALPITMTNSGNATLNIASIAITGTNAGDFSQTSTCQQTLAANASCTINVVFKPTDSGQRTAGVAITSDARGSVPVVTLSGTGLSTGLDLSSALLIFQNQTVSTTSPAQSVTLSNASAAAIAISNIAITGDFAQTSNCGTSVAASSSCTFQVTFTPTATGSRQGALSITAADSANPHVVTLSGTGVVVTVTLSPTTLSFADQTLGTASQAQGITLTNTGGAALTIASIDPSGDFLETNNCGTGLAAGASCTVSVSFLPTALGTRTGTITVTSNAQGSPHTASLTGHGVSTGPAVSLACPTGGSGSVVHANVAKRGFVAAAATPSCGSLTFPAQAVGTTSTALNVVLTNTGNAPLTFSGVAASGDFAASSNCPASLAAAASCNISITFTPTNTGTRSGLLTVQDNAGDAPQSLSLNGTGTPSGPAIGLSATAVPFGNQLLGSTSAAQTVTVSNNGNATLTFTSIKASGDFAETDNCANGVAANSSCTISVTFAPTVSGARAGAITLSDNGPASPQSITLSGNGTDIIITPAPGSSTAATITAGQSAAFQLSIAPAGGFSGSITVSCAGAIPAGTCAVSPNSFSLDAPVTVTATATTTAPTKSMMPPAPQGPGWSPRDLDALRVLLQSFLALTAFLAFAIAVRRRRRTWVVVTAALFLVALASGISGCAGGSGNPGVVGQTVGTPSGTYTVTMTVTTSTGGTRSIPLTVKVQ